MKKYIILLLAAIALMSLQACDSSKDELEQLKLEYSKYEPYSGLIDALESGDYDVAEKMIEGMRKRDYNEDISHGNINEVRISSENWSEYFEVKKITEWTSNDMGEPTGFITHACICLRDSYAAMVNIEDSSVNFSWEAMCSVKNCEVDLENRIVSIENVFKSNSTTFGDPERLSGTVSFRDGLYEDDFLGDFSVVSKIGEIVLVGEYLLNGEPKSVCFDYDDIMIVDAEGVLTIIQNGE